MNKNIAEIEINDTLVEIKAKRDDRHTSGWSVIAFTPEVSIRSTKLHRSDGLISFCGSIMGACGIFDEDVTENEISSIYNKLQSLIVKIMD